MSRDIRIKQNLPITFDTDVMSTKVMGFALVRILRKVAQRAEMEHDAAISAKTNVIGGDGWAIWIAICYPAKRNVCF